MSKIARIFTLKKANKTVVYSSLLMVFWASSFEAYAEDGVTVRGDQESPTVLYLVPWQKVPPAKNNSDIEFKVEYEFDPIKRSEVIRNIRYFKQLKYDKKKVKTKVKTDGSAVIRR